MSSQPLCIFLGESQMNFFSLMLLFRNCLKLMNVNDVSSGKQLLGNFHTQPGLVSEFWEQGLTIIFHRLSKVPVNLP